MSDDPHRWLEALSSEQARAWVWAQNTRTAQWAQGAHYARTRAKIESAFAAEERASPRVYHGHRYTWYANAQHPRGLLARAPWPSSDDASSVWEDVLDVRALAEAEGRPWVLRGALFPTFAHSRCLVQLSLDGSGPVELREFDLERKAFVPQGFCVPVAKNEVVWADPDTLLVASVGLDSPTCAGYPRTVRRWRRGTPLAHAPVLLRADEADVLVRGYQLGPHTVVVRYTSYYKRQIYWLDATDTPHRFAVPEDVEMNFLPGWVFMGLHEPWESRGVTHPADTWLAIPTASLMAGGDDWQTVYAPAPGEAVQSFDTTCDHAILCVRQGDFSTHLQVLHLDAGTWRTRAVSGLPSTGALKVTPLWGEANEFFVQHEDALTPPTLWHGDCAGALRVFKQTRPTFDTTGLHIEQHHAVSRDGTRVPYWQVSRKDLPRNGENRTLLTAYGGFGTLTLPRYDTTLGRLWLAERCVFVQASIRGGGELGTGWRNGARKHLRHKAHEDLAAVAEDLCRRGVTRRQSLGVWGGSNGGLLVGNMLTRYPRLFGAVICEVPLLDLERYTQLSTGPAYVDEFGDPAVPEEWERIQALSPYHNVREGVDYPPALFVSSTCDDRAPPAHARKMVEKLQRAGQDAAYYEAAAGGHSVWVTTSELVDLWSMRLEFLRLKLA